MGVTHLLIYDHVVGVDRNRPGGFEGPYDSNVAFHEAGTPLVVVEVDVDGEVEEIVGKLIGELAEAYNRLHGSSLKTYRVPVGFKWFVPGLQDGSIGFGGEESAGASFLRKDGTRVKSTITKVFEYARLGTQDAGVGEAGNIVGLAGLAVGIGIGSVWNYALSSCFVWGRY